MKYWIGRLGLWALALGLQTEDPDSFNPKLHTLIAVHPKRRMRVDRVRVKVRVRVNHKKRDILF